MVQQERARMTRVNILQGAAEVIRRVGYANATLGDIAEASGVTRGALYFHFESKEAIAHALIEEQHRATREAAESILDSDSTPVELMMQFCHDLAMRLIDDPIVRAGIRLTTDSSTFSIPMQDPYRDWMDTFEHLAGRAEREGETNGRVPPDVLARVIVPSFTGIQLVSETFSGRQDLPDRIHELWRVLLCAIMPSDRLDDMLAVAEGVFTVSAPPDQPKQ